MASNNTFGSTMSLNYGNLKTSLNYSTMSLMSMNSTTSSVSTKVCDFNTKGDNYKLFLILYILQK